MSISISRTALLLVAATTLLSGCSEEPQSASKQGQQIETTTEAPPVDQPMKGGKENQKQNEFLTAPPPPETFEQIQNTPAGALSGLPFLENVQANQSILDSFPALAEQSSQEEWATHWAKLISLYGENYPDPANLVIQNAYGDPNAPDSRFHLKKNYNIEIILDASGSMAGKIGGQAKMDIAKKAIQQFVHSLPKEAKVALRVYGHKGSNDDSDKERSCASSELVYSLQPSDRTQFDQSLNQFQATGWTPIAKALEEAAKDLSPYDEKENTNIIFLVSDGIETCGGDPVAVAQKLNDSPVKPFINVIGFDVDQQGQQQLKQIAAAMDGLYANANNSAQLQQQFNQAGENAKRWADFVNESNQQAYDIKKQNYEDLNDWRFQNKEWNEREAKNLRDAIQYLKETGKIKTMEQELFLLEKVQARQGMIIESANALWSKLLDQNDQNYIKVIEDNARKLKENTNF